MLLPVFIQFPPCSSCFNILVVVLSSHSKDVSLTLGLALWCWSSLFLDFLSGVSLQEWDGNFFPCCPVLPFWKGGIHKSEESQQVFLLELSMSLLPLSPYITLSARTIFPMILNVTLCFSIFLEKHLESLVIWVHTPVLLLISFVSFG